MIVADARPKPDFVLIIQTAFKLKDRMIALNKTYVWTHCPICAANGTKGKLYGRLVGRKLHLHAHCTTDGCVTFME